MLTRNKPMSRGAGFQRLPTGHPDRQAKPARDPDDYASYRAPSTQAVMATPASFDVAAVIPHVHAKLSREARTDDAIRDSANGEECHVRLPGVCNGRTDTTVWSHWPGLDGDRGMGLKALDLCGCYTCASCHDAIDGRADLPFGITRTEVQWAWFHGHLRSLVTLARKGLT